MRWKLILLGGLAFYAAMWIVSMASSPMVHEGLLKATYQAHAHLWRPELNKVPPDMAALLPRWILTGLLGSFIQVWIYGIMEPALAGPGWKKGLKFGGILCLFGATWALGYSGIFNAPDKVWTVWTLESAAYYLPAGALLGWLSGRFHW